MARAQCKAILVAVAAFSASTTSCRSTDANYRYEQTILIVDSIAVALERLPISEINKIRDHQSLVGVLSSHRVDVVQHGCPIQDGWGDPLIASRTGQEDEFTVSIYSQRAESHVKGRVSILVIASQAPNATGISVVRSWKQ